MIKRNYLENGTTEVVFQNEQTAGVVGIYRNGVFFDNTFGLIFNSNDKIVLKFDINEIGTFSRVNNFS